MSTISASSGGNNPNNKFSEKLTFFIIVCIFSGFVISRTIYGIIFLFIIRENSFIDFLKVGIHLICSILLIFLMVELKNNLKK